jgi:hypothetical protein
LIIIIEVTGNARRAVIVVSAGFAEDRSRARKTLKIESIVSIRAAGQAGTIEEKTTTARDAIG